MNNMNELLNYIDTSSTFRIVLELVSKFWIFILIIIIALAFQKKEDNFIPLSKIKGFIKKDKE